MNGIKDIVVNYNICSDCGIKYIHIYIAELISTRKNGKNQ